MSRPAHEMRKGYSEIELRLSRVKNEDLADALEVSPAQASRIKSGENGITPDKIDALLVLLGLHVFPSDQETETLPKAEAEALRLFARKGIGHEGPR